MLTTDHTCGQQEAADERGALPREPRGKRAAQKRPRGSLKRRREKEERQQQQRQQVSRSTAQNTIMKEQLWPNRVANAIVLQPLHPLTGASLHDEHATAVLVEPALHLELSQRDVTAGMRTLWKTPIDVISKCCQEAFTVAEST